MSGTRFVAQAPPVRNAGAIRGLTTDSRFIGSLRVGPAKTGRKQGVIRMPRNPSKWEGIDLCDGRYSSLEKLGEGGMGYVYKARDKRMGRFVVIKVPRAEMIVDSQFRKRFTRELQSLVKLEHRHIVAIQDYNQEDKIPYAVMQYLPKGDLEDRRSEDPRELNSWLKDIASALDFVHEKGYVHRDVKPGNILFDDQGYAYLSDFGIAKVVADSEDDQQGITRIGFAVGTPQYMAPELSKKTFDGRVDQYALAVTVYELLAGGYPFEGETTLETIQMHARKEIPPVFGISDDLNKVIRKGMAKNPVDRYPACVAFAHDILRCVQEVAPRGPFSVTKPTPIPKGPVTKPEPVPVGGAPTGAVPGTAGKNPRGTIVEPVPGIGGGGGRSSGGGGKPEGETKPIAGGKVDTKKTQVQKKGKGATVGELFDRKSQRKAGPLSRVLVFAIFCVIPTLVAIAILLSLLSGGGNSAGKERLIGAWRWDYNAMLKSAPRNLRSQVHKWKQSGVDNLIEFREDGVLIERRENSVVPSESRSEFVVTSVEESKRFAEGHKIEIEVTPSLSNEKKTWVLELNKYNTRGTLTKKDSGMGDISIRSIRN